MNIIKRQGSREKLALFWLRRDLRLDDNAGLFHALKENKSVLPVFIFDSEILQRLKDPDDPRVTFIYDQVLRLKNELQQMGSDLWILQGKPVEVFTERLKKEVSLYGDFEIESVYCNHDYEPRARDRDAKVKAWADGQGIRFLSYKDQVIFEKSEVMTDAQKPYTVYTPYKKKWLSSLSEFYLKSYPNQRYARHFFKTRKHSPTPTLAELGFSRRSGFDYPSTRVSLPVLQKYSAERDFPALDATSRLGLHLRFGTVSVRDLARVARAHSEVWLSELIWREFFMQILFHFPRVVKESFRPEYEKIQWRTSESDFEKWCQGKTGYPLVDAGMRELNQTGHMHNRVRMLTASFLTKHLLIHWSRGERYFAAKLLDYDLASNNGNWQWAAGTGCDAAPYFRIFNPTTQIEKFDKDFEYIKKWVPEWKTSEYALPMVDHVEARERCLGAFALGLKGKDKK
jgi:deoxyribodipyrimidine photo-lyase